VTHLSRYAALDQHYQWQTPIELEKTNTTIKLMMVRKRRPDTFGQPSQTSFQVCALKWLQYSQTEFCTEGLLSRHCRISYIRFPHPCAPPHPMAEHGSQAQTTWGVGQWDMWDIGQCHDKTISFWNALIWNIEAISKRGVSEEGPRKVRLWLQFGDSDIHIHMQLADEDVAELFGFGHLPSVLISGQV
jgi:hypothetical protein